MAKLSHAERSEISKRAWRKRKREGGKAKCAFCGKLIFARGVRMNGKPYHKGCAEAKGAGLKPAQVGKNPKQSFTDAWSFVKGLIDSQGHLWPRHMGRLDVTEVIEFGTIADDYGLTDKGYNDLIDKAQKYYDTHIIGLKNPGTNWHVDRGSDLLAQRATAIKLGNKKESAKLLAKIQENIYAAERSRKLGMNPRKISERKRAPRDAFRYFGAEELENPIGRLAIASAFAHKYPAIYKKVRAEVKKEKQDYVDRLVKARVFGTQLRRVRKAEYITGYTLTELRRRYPKLVKEVQKELVEERAKWTRMGVRPNPKFKFGPTGFRPPAKWFAKMAQGTSASHFGRKLKELTAAQRAKVGQIVGGIWAKYTDATRIEILRKYEPSAARALANPSTFGKRTQMLSCPACGGPNPVSRLNVYLRCNECGAPLRSVRVRHKR